MQDRGRKEPQSLGRGVAWHIGVLTACQLFTETPGLLGGFHVRLCLDALVARPLWVNSPDGIYSSSVCQGSGLLATGVR